MVVMIDEFRQQINEHGLDPGDIIADSAIHRFPTWGDANGETAGAYCLNDRFGWFQDHRTMPKPQVVVSGKLSEADQRALAVSYKGNKSVPDEVLRKDVRRILDNATSPNGHPYLIEKQIDAPPNVRQHEGQLAVPVFSITNLKPGESQKLNGLQRISADGTKRFLRGTRKKGSMHVIPGDNTRVVVCEGLSTAMSIHMATRYTSCVAFDAGNLIHVARNLSKVINPENIIIAGDDDSGKSDLGRPNIGAHSAMDAATAIGARVTLPEFSNPDGKRTTDFNDLHRLEGLEAVKVQVEKAKAVGVAASAKDEDWGEPIDIFSQTAAIASKWSEEFAPSVISEFGYDAAERMGVRPEQIIGPAIINAAGVIDDDFRLQPKENDHTWSESARLNGVIIGPSGSKKSPGKQQVDRVVKSIQKKKIEKHMEEMEAFEALSKDDQKTTKRPVLERIVCGDTTVEGLRDILKIDGGARKIICSWDEMSGWFGSFDIYQNTGSKGISRDRAAFMELNEGGPKSFDRVSLGFTYVPNWSACIFGTTTPGSMEEYFGRLNTDGLLQRFLLYKAEQTGPGIDREPDDVAIDRYEKTIRDLVALKPGKITTFKLNKEAQEIRIEFERLARLAGSLPGATEAFKSHLNKYPGLFCRLALTYHVAEAMSQGKNPADRVSREIADMTASALIEYHMPFARNFYKTLGYEDREENAAGDVCGYILAHKLGEIATSTIGQSVRSLKNRVHEIRNVMEILEAYNWVKVSKKIAGYKATQWIVNPAVHKLFEEQAKAEKKRRQEIRAKIAEAVRTFANEGNENE